MTTQDRRLARTRRSFLRSTVKTIAVGAGLATLPQGRAFAESAVAGSANARAVRKGGPDCTTYCSPVNGCYGCPPGWSMLECRDICGTVWCECFDSCSGRCISNAPYC